MNQTHTTTEAPKHRSTETPSLLSVVTTEAPKHRSTETPSAPFTFPSQSNTWDAVRYWAGMSERFARAGLACQVMAGFSLLELHAFHTVRPGNKTGKNQFSKEELPINSVIPPSSVSPCLRGESWSSLVKHHAGISDDTARNWMAMAKGVKSRWKKLPIRDRLRELMSSPPSAWAEDDAKLISDAVHKATDGYTQMEFMLELGIAKKPQGSGAKGRKPGEGGRPADTNLDASDDDDAALNEFRADLRLFTHPDDDTLRKCSTQCLTVHTQEIKAYLDRIHQILAKRRSLTNRNTEALKY